MIDTQVDPNSAMANLPPELANRFRYAMGAVQAASGAPMSGADAGAIGSAANAGFAPTPGAANPGAANPVAPAPSANDFQVMPAANEQKPGFWGQAWANIPGQSKGQKLLSLLSGGLQGALAGRAAQENMAAQTGGRRAGGVGTGFMAGMMLPWQRAEAAQKFAQGQAGLQPVETPFGTLPAEYATRGVLPWMIRGQAMQNVADTNAQSKTNAANISAQGGIQKQNVATQGMLAAKQLEAAIMAGTVSKFMPDVDPQSGQMFYRTFNKFGKEMQPVDVNIIPSLMAKSASTVTYQQMDDGSIMALPKTTTTQPVIPGRGTAPTPAPAVSGAPTPATNARPVTGANGQPLQGKGASAANSKWVTWDEGGREVAGPVSLARQNGIADFSEVPAQEIRDITNARHAVNLATKQGDPSQPDSWGVLQLVNSLNADGKLGIAASRWNNFMARKIGAAPGDDPRIISLLDKGELLMTASMQAHFGASGGRSPQMLEHFLNMANSKEMNGPTLLAGFKAVTNYMQDRAMMPGTGGAPNRGASPNNRPPLGSFEH